MIGTLRGIVAATSSDSVIIDVNGVGYVVYVPTSTLESLAIDGTILLHTHLAVREDSMTLYGFTQESDKDMFDLLISVSGVGPRLGLAILSKYSAGEVVEAIRLDTPDVFSSVSGIGKKNAQRIILELKNKLPAFDFLPQTTNRGSTDLQEAMQALGYSIDEIRRASKDIDPSLSLQDQIKLSLANLAKS